MKQEPPVACDGEDVSLTRSKMSTSIEMLKKKNFDPVTIVSLIPDQTDEFRDKLRILSTFENTLPEFRFDLMSETGFDGRINILKKIIENQSDSILTYRSNNIEELNKFYSISLENGENLVDIDGTVLDKIGFKPSPKHTLISYHLNQVTPIRDLVSNTYQRGYRAVKMAVRIDQDYEFFSLCREIALNRKEGRIISIVPMGTGSGIYRLISAITVSDFTYTKYGIETGEGQFDFRLFQEIKSNIKSNAEGNDQLI